MTFLERARYAAYLAVVAGAILSLILALASADGIALLPPGAFDIAFSPVLMISTYVLAFLVAPAIANRLPIKRK